MRSSAFVVFISLCWLNVAYSQTSPEVRTWSDATGAFKLEAQLLKVEADSVTLKRKDGKEIKLPIAKLSQADRSFLQQNPGGTTSTKSFGITNAPTPQKLGPANLLHELGTSAGVLPTSESVPPLVGVSALGPLDADPATSLFKFVKPFATPVCEVDAYDKLSRPFCLDADQGILAVSVGRRLAGQTDTRGRLFRMVAGQRKADLLIDAPETVDLLAHDNATGHSLLIAGRNELYHGGELVLVDGLIQGSVNILKRLSLPGMDTPGFKPTVEWAL